ncbi:uncharacterized protein [Paramisgurnus dabryanus]|uniref:uncharacterized protein n=1 Tax=Paramisgurnus dabryanus TaxID=90735 RepID=UPI0031F3E80B
MRHLMALMFLVIFCSLQLTSSAPFASNLAKSSCCYEFSNAAIPLKLVKSYYRTASSCTKPAIVFLTKKRKICVDPETSWVSGHINEVDNRTTKTQNKTKMSRMKQGSKTKSMEEPNSTLYLEAQHNFSRIHFFTSSKTMRHLMALMVLVIFCSLQLTLSAPVALDNSICCFKFSNAQIPLKLVKSYYWTDSSCPKPAIVFETDKRRICVDPKTSWVSNHITEVDNSAAKTQSKTV